MIPTLLIALHFLSFSLGIGGGLANLVIGARAARAEPDQRPALAGAARIVGLIATAGLALLWLTGITLVSAGWGGWATLPVLFWAKLAAVLVLTVCSVLANAALIAARRTGAPPPSDRMAMLGRVGVTAAVLALLLAVAAFRA